MSSERDYMAGMLSDADFKRLHWRAHHRGTKEADMLIGGFFDAHHGAWGADDCALFETMLEEQDVDIMAWALGTLPLPQEWRGPMWDKFVKMDFVEIGKK